MLGDGNREALDDGAEVSTHAVLVASPDQKRTARKIRADRAASTAMATEDEPTVVGKKPATPSVGLRQGRRPVLVTTPVDRRLSSPLPDNCLSRALDRPPGTAQPATPHRFVDNHACQPPRRARARCTSKSKQHTSALAAKTVCEKACLGSGLTLPPHPHTRGRCAALWRPALS
jgi:hypothetical protein